MPQNDFEQAEFVEAAPHNLEIQALVESESLARRAAFALGLTRLMSLGIGIMTVGMVIVWLLDTQYTQLLWISLAQAQVTLCAGLYTVFHRRRKYIAGFYLFLFSFMTLMILSPPLMPFAMIPVSVGIITVIALSNHLLGNKRSRWLVIMTLVAYGVDVVLVKTEEVTDWFTPLPDSTETMVGISIAWIAMIIGVVLMRQMSQGQEEQFWEAQMANLEIERRMAEEFMQREQLTQANLEIEQRAAIERQQSAHLRDLTVQILDTANQLTSAASELQATISQQTASAAEQNAVVTQIAATVEEVRATVLQTMERAQNVANASQESMTASHTGNQVISETIDGMALIGQQVEDIAETILLLSERTQQIGEIIETVNGLADQSKLLSLNASIEAARAGEEGKGFAVVAMEVRQLADQSREATARVRDILNDIQSATNTAVMVTEQGSKGAEQGMALAEGAGEVIKELTTTVETAARTSEQIAVSTRQQTNGVDQLATAMSQIKQASTQNAAAMKQAEQSVRDLMVMANQLEEVAGRYDLQEMNPEVA